MDGIAKAKDRGVKFERKRELTDERVKELGHCVKPARPCRLSSNRQGLARPVFIERRTSKHNWSHPRPPGVAKLKAGGDCS